MGLNKFQDVTTILFDLDNTLINTRAADLSACEQVCQHLQDQGVRPLAAQTACDRFYTALRKHPQDPLDPDSEPGQWRQTLWREALGPGLAGHAAAAHTLWREARLARLRLLPGLEPLLAELRGKYKLGIVTNGPSASQWEKISRVGVAKFFDAIVVSGDVHVSKPSSGIFEEAFRLLDASRQECAVVGDRLDTDILGAARAGVAASVWVAPEGAPDGDPRPDFRLAHTADLACLLPPEAPLRGFTTKCRERALEVLRDEAYRIG